MVDSCLRGSGVLGPSWHRLCCPLGQLFLATSRFLELPLSVAAFFQLPEVLLEQPISWGQFPDVLMDVSSCIVVLVSVAVVNISLTESGVDDSELSCAHVCKRL